MIVKLYTYWIISIYPGPLLYANSQARRPGVPSRLPIVPPGGWVGGGDGGGRALSADVRAQHSQPARAPNSGSRAAFSPGQNVLLIKHGI